ncbi:hypothetical protein MMON_53390 [Mycolicibacterium monacense]|uniref:Uncharacterized protein n=1 Tax=Mycolicibacterium monacense TaxID=85693 RepID=A0AAD1J0Q6_MYCMB|nr:hypothetical protein MMON_53390 [Mycolicibacterium monacense]
MSDAYPIPAAREPAVTAAVFFRSLTAEADGRGEAAAMAAAYCQMAAPTASHPITVAAVAAEVRAPAR